MGTLAENSVTLSLRRFLSYDLQSKLVDWFERDMKGNMKGISVIKELNDFVPVFTIISMLSKILQHLLQNIYTKWIKKLDLPLCFLLKKYGTFY